MILCSIPIRHLFFNYEANGRFPEGNAEARVTAFGRL